jgi:hypothetical protein
MLDTDSGFGVDYNFVDLLQNFSDELGFFVASGEWSFTVVYRNRSPEPNADV